MSSTERETAVQQSPLLNLPGEIRNRIYYWALLTPSNTLNLSATSEDKRVNQLQYACVQLRRETQLLEFKVNPVIEIVGEVKSKPSGKRGRQSLQHDKATEGLLAGKALEQSPNRSRPSNIFMDFARGIEPSKLSWLRTVIMSNKMPDDHTAWSKMQEMAVTLMHLTRICQNNPELKIRYNISTFGHTKPDSDLAYSIIYHGIAISQMLREEPLQHMLLIGLNMARNLENIIAMWRKLDVYKWLIEASDEKKRVRAKQIRFFPNPNIVTAQSYVGSATATPAILQAHVEGVLPLWKATAKKWVEEGI
jgi:hypothetical protein